MAKGLRASSKKANRTKLRAGVFGPVEQARAERLHAKLLETIQQPKPESNKMDTAQDDAANEATSQDDLPKDMDVDTSATASAKSSSKTKDKSQTRKQLRRKPHNKVSFPTSQGKGALKPFKGQRAGPGRIGKRRA